MTPAEFVAIMERELPLGVMLQVEPLEIAADRALFRLPFRADFLRPGGTVAGPMMMALADIAMYAVVLAVVPGAGMAVTSNLSMNFLRRPPPAAILAEARMLRAGKRLAVGEVELFAEGDPEMVAHATLTYVLPAPTPSLLPAE